MHRVFLKKINFLQIKINYLIFDLKLNKQYNLNIPKTVCKVRENGRFLCHISWI